MIRITITLVLAVLGGLPLEDPDVYYPEPGSTPPPENYEEGDDPARPPDVWPEPAAPAAPAAASPSYTG